MLRATVAEAVINKPDMKSICICPKDISKNLGYGERKAQRMLNKIKQHLKKEKHQFVTKKEFAEYAGIPEDELL